MLKFQDELTALRLKGLERKCRFISTACDAHIKIKGKKLLNLCSNNYLGLANDIRIKNSAIKAIREFGVGAGASRLVTGSNILHKRLEDKLADFKRQEACLIYSSGYSANLGIISALVGRDDAVFSDRLNHASIIDGIILSRAELARYPHKDIKVLEKLLRIRAAQDARRKTLIITDSVFSMDGDIAPVPELIALARKYDCLLMLDEAHATGVLGKNGRGTLEHFGLSSDERIIQMGTLSKAIGGLGGFVCGRKDLIKYLINRSRSFIFSTALPPALCASAVETIDIIEEDGSLRKRLWDNANFLRNGLQSLGFDTLASQTPIIPVLTREPKLTMEFSQELFKEGIFVQGIRPPTVPEGFCRLRVTVMATHTLNDLQFALSAFKKIGHRLDIIQ
ncbi:MAG: 8-amino-7-oxononanoate synthase [Omnitrophica WOR_2 bacterium RIFCSPHIGHO2_02_FULL_45_21]|nr:MAG: 8-amino-7-oxononanoate synthase [Omnitrophica WOR_2 bacterium RIFCSPHIGHO2_02_FULL_45_21]